MDRSVRTGVIGFGLAGQVFHAAVVAETPGMELAAIVQRSGDLAAQRYPAATIYRSLEAMLAEAQLDLCIVGTPNDQHVPMAEACLRAGRHVVIDKPFALASGDVLRLAAIAREKNLVLAAYHNRRSDGDHRTVRELLESGRLGALRRFSSHFDRFRPEPKPGAWRETVAAGGGLLFDLGPHLLDEALALFGAPTSIWADVRVERDDVVVDDAFDLELAYDQSADVSLRRLRVSLHATAIAASPGPRYAIHGTRGSFVKYGIDPQEAALKQGMRFADAGFGREPEEQWGTLTLPLTEEVERVPTLPGDYRLYYANVRDAILGKAPLAVTAADAWRVATLIEAARESSRTGCRIKLDLEAANQL